MGIYYTLLIRQDNRWYIEFGDYSKHLVYEEKREWQYNGTLKKDTKVIRTLEDQSEVDKAVKLINNGDKK